MGEKKLKASSDDERKKKKTASKKFWNLIWDLANQSPLCGIQSLINGFQVDIGLGKVEGELYS